MFLRSAGGVNRIHPLPVPAVYFSTAIERTCGTFDGGVGTFVLQGQAPVNRLVVRFVGNAVTVTLFSPMFLGIALPLPLLLPIDKVARRGTMDRCRQRADSKKRVIEVLDARQ